MADVSVRPATPDDAAEVARVQLVTWRTAYADLLPPEALDADEDELAALWRRSVHEAPSARHRLLVAQERDAVVGFAACAPAEDDGPEVGELAALLVEPRWGRRGHGSRLLAAAVDLWRAEGTTTAVTWAWQRDAVTQAFLTGAGWAPDGARRGLDVGARVEQQVRLHVSLEEP